MNTRSISPAVIGLAAFCFLLTTGSSIFAQCPPEPPTLFAPGDDPDFITPVPSPVSFDWDGNLPDTEFFEIHIVGPENFDDEASPPFDKSLLDGNYEWWVTAHNDTNECPVQESPHWFVSVESDGGGGDCPEPPIPAFNPVGDVEVQSPVLFDWDGNQPNVELYEIHIRGPEIFDGQAAPPFEKTLPTGNYEWWYTVFNNANECPAEDSFHEFFSVVDDGGGGGGECPAGPLTLLAPSPGASVTSPVSFSWDLPGYGGPYRLEVTEAGAIVFDGNFPTPDATIDLPAGMFDWKVSALDCPDLVSATRQFTVGESGDCGTTQPASLIGPPSGVTSPSLVFFEWTEVPGANGYEVLYSANGGAFVNTGIIPDTFTSLTLPTGLVQWRVDTYFPGCEPLPSLETFDLIVEGDPTGCGDQVLTPIRPAMGESVQSPVTFEWTTVPDAVNYTVWASFEGQPFAPMADVSDASQTSVPLPSGPVEWFVEAQFDGCPPFQSPPSIFTVEGGGTSCDGAEPPQLLTPERGETDVSSPINFSWKPVNGAVGYRIVASINGEPPGEIGYTSETTLLRELPPGVIDWWVEAVIEGCGVSVSETSQFTALGGDAGCPPAGATPVSPAAGVTSSSVVEFSWTASGVESIYRIWVMDSLQGLEFVIGETFETSFEAFLPPGGYSWWIEAFGPQCPPSISPPTSFTVTEGGTCSSSLPQNVTPSNGATDVTSPVMFSWTTVKDAFGYEVWAQAEDGFEFPIEFSEQTSVEAHLPPGTWSWFVLALIDGCEPVHSVPTKFTISADQQCDIPPPFLLHPPADDDIVLSANVLFEWTRSPGANQYELYTSVKGSAPTLLTTTTDTLYEAQLPDGTISWYVVAKSASCPPVRSSNGRFQVSGTQSTCEPPESPAIGAVPQATSSVEYVVGWTAVPFATSYEVQESTSTQFETPTSYTATKLSKSFTNTVETPTPYYYRVRAIPKCDTQASLFSEVIRVMLEPDLRNLDVQLDTVDRIGNTGKSVKRVFVAGGSTTQSFTASTTQTWMSVSPTSGTLPPEGTELKITIDLSLLAPGATTGQIVLALSGAGKSTFDGSSSTPVTVSLVTPVTSTTRSSTTPSSLIIPAVGHAAGFNSQWQSDIRITNVTSQSINYRLFFTPSGKAGTGKVKKASVSIAPGKTIAFNDILKTWYGIGSGGESATGTLEIRPQSQASSTASLATSTVASSRTYNVSSSGTFGQFIPAVEFSKFAAKGTILSLQQLAQSADYRTNIGLVEGSGETATVRFTVYDSSGTQLDQFTKDLLAGEHRQYDRILADRGIATDNARVEIEVISDKGKVTAYASKVDNLTGDPELITPVNVAKVSSSKTVLAGVGDFDNGLASWRTDLRVFNGGSTSESAMLTYYPEGESTNPSTKTVTVGAGEVLEMNDLLRSYFNLTNKNGALHVTTSNASQLVATARTYNKTSSGTYGQFIPGIRLSQAVGAGSRALQILQVEQSPQFRTNLGLFEMSGNPVTVEVTAIVPRSLVATSKRYDLKANEFRQINPIMTDLGINEAYNSRLVIKVVSGSGKINAYASVVDMSTQDPTYVPAQ